MPTQKELKEISADIDKKIMPRRKFKDSYAEREKKDRKPKPKGRCEIRAFEIIFNDVAKDLDQKALFKEFCGKQYGVYAGFCVTHTEEEDTHIHCGVILRDKPKKLKWSGLKKYFTVGDVIPNPKSQIPNQHGRLKNKSKNFERKLQTYYDYCVNQEKHEGQQIGEPYTYKWKPRTKSETAQDQPLEYLTDLIFNDLAVDELDDNIDESDVWTNKTRAYALRNYEKLEKMIDKLRDIRERKAMKKLYRKKKEGYRPFQKALTEILDNQNNRNIHNHYDDGKTGKNHWLDVETLRPDTVVLQSAETKRIAYYWDPQKHKRIIFDIPKHKMQYVNTSVIEKLKNGTLFSEMHHPKMKKSLFKPTIVILGNEQIPRESWTDDRATYSTTTNKGLEAFQYKKEEYNACSGY